VRTCASRKLHPLRRDVLSSVSTRISPRYLKSLMDVTSAIALMVPAVDCLSRDRPTFSSSLAIL